MIGRAQAGPAQRERGLTLIGCSKTGLECDLTRDEAKSRAATRTAREATSASSVGDAAGRFHPQGEGPVTRASPLAQALPSDGAGTAAGTSSAPHGIVRSFALADCEAAAGILMSGNLAAAAPEGRKLAKLQRALGVFVLPWVSVATAGRPTDGAGTAGSCVSL